MEGDRGAALICQAARLGLVDFSESRPLDRKWNLRLEILLSGLEQDNVRKLYEIQHAQHCAALEYLAGKEAFEHHWDGAGNILARIQRKLFPWLKKESTRSTREQIAQDLRKQYVAIFGDPTDPAVKAGIDATVKHLRSR